MGCSSSKPWQGGLPDGTTSCPTCPLLLHKCAPETIPQTTTSTPPNVGLPPLPVSARAVRSSSGPFTPESASSLIILPLYPGKVLTPPPGQPRSAPPSRRTTPPDHCHQLSALGGGGYGHGPVGGSPRPNGVHGLPSNGIFISNQQQQHYQAPALANGVTAARGPGDPWDAHLYRQLQQPGPPSSHQVPTYLPTYDFTILKPTSGTNQLGDAAMLCVHAWIRMALHACITISAK